MAWPIPAAVRLGRQPGGGASRVRMRMDHRANLRLPAEAPDPDRGPRRNGEPQHGLGLDQQLVLQWQQQAGNAAVTHLLLGGGRAAAVQRRLRGRRPAGRTNPELDDAWVARLVDPVVPSRSAQDEGHPQLQRQEGKGGKRSRITQGPGDVPEVQVGRRFPIVYRAGGWRGTSVILDVFEQGGKIMIAWYDVSRSRHEVRPLDLFEDYHRAGPTGEMRPSDWRAYSLLDKVSPREWYEHRSDPVGFLMGILETLRPGTAEEKQQVERTLAPAAYRAAIKRLALDNLAEGEKESRELLGRGPAFFASLAKPWGVMSQQVV